MKPLFEVKPLDRRFYEERLAPFLPERVVDVHTHIWLDRFKREPHDAVQRTVTWPSRVAKDNPVEDLLATYQLLLPAQRVVPLVFSTVEVDYDAANDYVAASAARHQLPALIFSDPQWSAESFEQRMLAGGFLGAKSYLTSAPAYLPPAEIRVFDFFPHHQLEVMNDHGWIVMLHVPRPGRLRDPVNLAQILEIERRYPRIQLIVAHVGRAYCPEDVGDAFEILKASRTTLFDFSANTNDWVFEQLIRCVGPKRILFGSDMPILRMRTRRICEKGLYVNLVPKGLYGDLSGDKNMREVSGREADELTFFLYEEIDAFRRAAQRTGLSADDVAAVFCGNAERALAAARG